MQHRGCLSKSVLGVDTEVTVHTQRTTKGRFIDMSRIEKKLQIRRNDRYRTRSLLSKGLEAGCAGSGSAIGASDGEELSIACELTARVD